MKNHGFTAENPYLIMFVLGAMMFPNAFAQVIALLRRRNGAPSWSFYVSLIMNAAYSCFICFGIGCEPHVAYVVCGSLLIGFAAFATMSAFLDLICCRCCCPKSSQCLHFVMRELHKGVYEKEQFFALIEANRAAPPLLQVVAKAWHQEIESGSGPDSQPRTVTRVTYHEIREFEYVSWEERGHPIRFDDNVSLIHGLFRTRFEMDEETESALNSMRETMLHEAMQRDQEYGATILYNAPDVVPVACATLADKKNCMQKYYGSICGKIVWFLVWLTGYQSLYECIWSSTGVTMKMTLVKRVSLSHDLRAERGGRDVVAAERSFRQPAACLAVIGPSEQLPSPGSLPALATGPDDNHDVVPPPV